MVDRTSQMMAISGIAGLAFFLIANFTDIFTDAAITAACCQLVINGFVFVAWLKGFRQSHGLKRFVAFWDVVVPIAMASITLSRVVLPALRDLVLG